MSQNEGLEGLPVAAARPPCGDASSGAAPGSSAWLDEPVLPDDYPIYAGYLYVADGKVIRSDWHGVTARQFKGREGITELRRCDIFGRQSLAKATGAR